LSLCPIYWETNDLLTSAFLRSVVRPSTKRSIWLPWLWNSSIGRRILIWRLSSIIVPKPCSAAAQTRLFIQYCIFTYFVRTDARTHCSTYRLDGQVCINIGVFDLLFLNLGLVDSILSINWSTTPNLTQFWPSRRYTIQRSLATSCKVTGDYFC